MQFPVLQALEKELAGKVRVRRECEFAHIKPLEQASSLLNRIFEPSTYSRAASVVIQWRPRFSAARAVVPDPAKRSTERSVGKECVSTCRFGWEPYYKKKKKIKQKTEKRSTS